jgi:cation:H+ antiporter
MASSISYGLVGILALSGFLLKRREQNFLKVSKTLVIPFIFVTLLFPATLIPSLIASILARFLFGALFLACYLVYVALMYRKGALETIDEAEDPYFCKAFSHKEIGGFLQLAVSVIILYFGASQLVGLVSQFATQVPGISPIGLSIVIIPAATVVPETMSALIWGFKGKDTLSLGSLVGEKVLFSTLYPAIGLFLTAWVLDANAYLSVLATSLVSLWMLFYVSKEKVPWYGLALGLALFVFYALAAFWLHV